MAKAAGQVADIIREMVPGADIDIADAMTPLIERYDLKCRGVHDMRPVEKQLGYQIKYRDVRPRHEGIRRPLLRTPPRAREDPG